MVRDFGLWDGELLGELADGEFSTFAEQLEGSAPRGTTRKPPGMSASPVSSYTTPQKPSAAASHPPSENAPNSYTNSAVSMSDARLTVVPAAMLPSFQSPPLAMGRWPAPPRLRAAQAAKGVRPVGGERIHA